MGQGRGGQEDRGQADQEGQAPGEGEEGVRHQRRSGAISTLARLRKKLSSPFCSRAIASLW